VTVDLTVLLLLELGLGLQNLEELRARFDAEVDRMVEEVLADDDQEEGACGERLGRRRAQGHRCPGAEGSAEDVRDSDSEGGLLALLRGRASGAERN
jgi:hypothetical protein